MPETQKKKSSASKKPRKSSASGKGRKPSAPRSAPAKGRRRSGSVIGTEGLLIHTDEGFFYVSEEAYKSCPLPSLGMGIAKVLTERGCIVASIPDDGTIVEGAYCYLISIANLNKTYE
ncbi:MAG: hypothetical protein JW940_05885 [Polyangiaceae bacterium]|nr:hypothetical protein [Polyangiaceae bacterium]